MNFFEKIEQNPYDDLRWNIPEQRQGIVSVIGGNAGTFRVEAKITEYLLAHYPLKQVSTVLPDALKDKLPSAPELTFLRSTESGSFASADELMDAFRKADYSILLGDLSKNAVTGRAVASACENSASPLLITRDAVDVIAENHPERILLQQNITFLASMPQLIKLVRAIYYPRMLTLSQSLMQVAETLHKLTLSYPVKLITLNNGQILVAQNGQVKAVALADSGYSALTFWSGELAAKIVALNLYNPDNFIPATICAIHA